MFLDANDELNEVLSARLLQSFHDLGNIRYSLACYECQLGNLESARVHFKETFEIEKRFRVDALDDPVLKPLWDSLATNSRVILE